MKRKKFLNLLMIIVVLLSFVSCTYSKNMSNDTTQPKDESKNCSLLFAGDVLVHDDQLKAAYDSSSKSYSFDNFFECVKDYISDADLSICNSETSYLGDKYGYSGYPSFNTPDSLLTSLKNAGFDVLASAHNHILDTGTSGFNRTAKVITDNGFDLMGIKNNEADKNYIVKELNGIKVGITNYTYSYEEKSGANSINTIKVPKDLKNRINLFASNNLNPYISNMKSTIENMKADGAEFIIFYMHWGEEYKTLPVEYQEQLAKILNEAGTDVIIGSHPHVVEPIRTIKSENSNKETLVFYSLGNFISNQRLETMGNIKSEDGLMVKLNLHKDDNNIVTLESYEAKPTWVNKFTDSNGKINYNILSVEDIIENEDDTYSEEVFNKIKNSYESTKEILNS